MRVFVLIASLISWFSILLFIVCAVHNIMLQGGFRRVAMHLRERALKRPANDPLHRLAIFTYTVEASLWKAAERRKWGRKATDDAEDEETVHLVEEGYRLVEASNKSLRTMGSSSAEKPSKDQRRVKNSPSLRHGSSNAGSPTIVQLTSLLPPSESEFVHGKGPPMVAKALLGRWRTARTENYEVTRLKLPSSSWVPPEQLDILAPYAVPRPFEASFHSRIGDTCRSS